MNWINELCDLYDKNKVHAGKIEYVNRKGKKGEEQIPQVLLPVFHTTVTAQITVDISEQGEFMGARRVAEEDKLTIIPVTEKSGSRTSGTEAHPFCDNLKYLAGDYMEYLKPGRKDFSKNYPIYLDQLEAWHLSEYKHKKVDALYTYLKKKTLIADLVKCGILILDEDGKLDEKEKIQNVAQSDAFVRFCIHNRMDLTRDILNDKNGISCPECWLDGTLQESYIAYYRSTLISSNDESNFTFRGRFANKQEAFAIGYEASQKVHNALKWIIRKQGYSRDGLCIVIWQSDMKELPKWYADTDSICEEYDAWDDEEEEEYSGTGDVFAARFKHAMNGYGNIKNLKPDSRVVLLAFDAATTGRLAMVENKVFESSRYIENISYWHESCRWLQTKYKDGHLYTYMGMAGIQDIAEALYGTEQNKVLTISGKTKMYAEICKRLLPCISDRKRIPSDLVNLAVQKASSPMSYENRYNWEKVLSIACSFVKKQRMERKWISGAEEEWNMEVNNLCENRNYLYGRLLAVADRIEYRTYDKEKDSKRVTNAKRYMNAFS